MYGFDISNERIKSVDSLPFLTYNPDMKGIMATADSNIYQDQSKSQALCRQCGKQIPIKAGKKQRKVYCSNLCRIKASTSQRKRYNKICKYCGKHYSTPRKVQKYCSRKCEGNWLRQEAAKKRMRICQWCGKEFVMNFMSGKARSGEVQEGLFCSRKCRWDWVKERTRTKNPPKCNIYFNKCVVCGKMFITKHNQKTICSDECQHLSWAKYQRDLYKDNWQQPDAFKCKECGRIYQPKFGEIRTIFCSIRCRNKYTRTNEKVIRRLRIENGFVEPVSRTEIFKRDGWRCHICGRKVNPKLKSPHPMSATIDHIIPLAAGGTHEPKNVALAHMICNSRKGSGIQPGGDQLRLFG